MRSTSRFADVELRIDADAPELHQVPSVARQRLSGAFTPEECGRFFRDDPSTCPQTVEALFALFDDEGS